MRIVCVPHWSPLPIAPTVCMVRALRVSEGNCLPSSRFLQGSKRDRLDQLHAEHPIQRWLRTGNDPHLIQSEGEHFLCPLFALGHGGFGYRETEREKCSQGILESLGEVAHVHDFADRPSVAQNIYDALQCPNFRQPRARRERRGGREQAR